MPYTDKIRHDDNGEEKKDDRYAGRLSKRLCYILRYGALKDGLNVSDEGFIDIKEVMELHIMRHHTEEEVLNEIETSMSHRNTRRFEYKQYNGKTYIRALFCRNFETSPYHTGSQVITLKQTCMNYVMDHLQDYDLEDFPDEFVISSMISQLKRRKKLNTQCLRTLLIPALEHLDLNEVYLTTNILKLVWSQCTKLRVLSLRDCGYIVTDSVVETLLRKLPYLESLNLAACKHITDKSMTSMCKYGKNLQELNLSWIKNLSESAILDLLVNCVRLKHLDVYDLHITGEVRALVIEAARQRNITLILKGLNKSDPDVTLENPSQMLPNFGKSW
ncbi:hypothetical protein ACF0H5_017800 [Mactra antiquata]